MAGQEYAFQCRNCGFLETADHAAEQPTPAACRNCGKGVKFDETTGQKSYDRDNWIVLADDEDAIKRLRKAGRLDDDDTIAAHEQRPSTATREPQNIERSTEDGMALGDHA